MKKALISLLVGCIFSINAMDTNELTEYGIMLTINNAFMRKVPLAEHQKLVPNITGSDSDRQIEITLDFIYPGITNTDLEKITDILTELYKESLKNVAFKLNVDLLENEIDEPLAAFEEFARVCNLILDGESRL